MGQLYTKVTSLFLALMLVGSSALAESGAAMLYPTGIVLLNGNAVPGATALFQGDTVSTTQGSIASFNTKNAQISITADTSLRINRDSVQLNKGVVTIDTKSGFQTRASRFEVLPAQGPAKYRVLRQGDSVLVASLSGPVLVKWEAKTHLIAAGSTWNSSSEAQDASGQEAHQGPQPVPAGKLPNQNKKGLSTGTIVLIGAGMGGLAAGLAYAASSGQSVSPIKP